MNAVIRHKPVGRIGVPESTIRFVEASPFHAVQGESCSQEQTR